MKRACALVLVLGALVAACDRIIDLSRKGVDASQGLDGSPPGDGGTDGSPGGDGGPVDV